MNKTFKILTVALLAMSFSFGLSAQKIAYINSAALLTELPEVKQARTNLETLTNQLKKRLENQIKGLQQKAQALEKEYKEGGLSPKELEVARQELAVEEQNLAKSEQEMSQQVIKKEQDLLQPILDKINTAIQNVAKENGYDYVFDLSQGSLLYWDPAHDIADKVRAKLATQ